MTNFTDDAGTLEIWRFMLLDFYGDDTGYLKPLNRQHLPFYSEWGCYPITYLTKQGNELCADCATKSLYLLDDEFDPPVNYGPYYEGSPIQCDDCGRMIESAYGDPDAADDDDYRDATDKRRQRELPAYRNGVTMKITVDITNRPAYHQQWGDYALQECYLRDDVTDALQRALDSALRGAVKVTVAVSRDGECTGSLTLDLE